MNLRRVLSRLLVLCALALLLAPSAGASIPSSRALSRADGVRGAPPALSSDQQSPAIFAGVSLDPEQPFPALVADSSPRLFDGVSLIGSQRRRAPPDFTLETRIGVIEFFGQPILAVHRGVNLELRWGSSGLFSDRASGHGIFTSTDPLGYPDSANPYVWGVSAPWANDPMGLCLGLSKEPCSAVAGKIEQAIDDRFAGQALPATGLLSAQSQSAAMRLLMTPVTGTLRTGEATGELYSRTTDLLSGPVTAEELQAISGREGAQLAGGVATDVMTFVAPASSLRGRAPSLPRPIRINLPEASLGAYRVGEVLPGGRLAGVGPGARAVVEPQPRLVYRRLRSDETSVLAKGLVARDPTARVTPEQHILGARQSQFISTTTDFELAVRGYGRSRQPVAEIDLDKVTNPVVDLTDPAVRGANLSDPRAIYNAERDLEILIEGRVPPEAVRRLIFPTGR